MKAPAWLPSPSRWLSQRPLARMLPFDAREIARALLRLNLHLARHPLKAGKHGGRLLRDQLAIVRWRLRRVADGAAPEAVPAALSDRRFADAAWREQPGFSALKQSYLALAQTLAAAAQDTAELDARERQRLQFYLRQFSDALSPANFPLSNPVVLRETLAARGANLWRGAKNLKRDLKRGEITVAPAGKFRVGGNLALTPGHIVRRNELMELIQYAPQTKTVHAIPVLLMPPWINKYYVMDLAPGKSLAEYLVRQGFTVFMLSWRNPTAAQHGIGMDDYLKLGPLEAIEAIRKITGAPRVNLTGYCLGGTLLAITLAWLAAKGDASANSGTYFTALQDFAEVGETAVFITEDYVEDIDRRMARRGYLDAVEMGSIFRLMRSNDLIWNFVVNNYWLGREPLAQDLMFWSSDGTRMPRRMHSWYLRNMYLENNLIRPGQLSLLGQPLDLSRIACPGYVVAGSEDHIVPWASAHRAADLFARKPRLILSRGGHITSIIAPPQPGRGHYAVHGADATRHHDGSWWPDWSRWLKRISGPLGPPPRRGRKSLGPARGTYVHET